MGERMTPAVLGKPKVPPMYPARRSSSGAMRLGGLTRRADGDLLRREDRRRGRYPAFCAPASAGQLESRPEPSVFNWARAVGWSVVGSCVSERRPLTTADDARRDSGVGAKADGVVVVP